MLQRQQILALNELGQAVTSSLKLEDVLLRVLVEVTALLGAEAVAILMPEEDELVFAAVCGPGAFEMKGKRLPAGEGVAGYVMRTGESVWVTADDAAVAGLAPHHTGEGDGHFRTQSLLAAPLRQGGLTIGVLEAAHSQLDGLSADDLPSLAAAANWAAIAISNAQLHEQAQQAREEQAQLEERNRLARELHDAVTQSLYSLTTLAGAWRRQIEAGQLQPQKDHIVELSDLARQALREVRLIIYELRPTELEEEGLLGALYRRLETVEQRAGVQTRLVVTDKNGRLHPMPAVGSAAMNDFYRLPPPVEQGLYRIIQEALNNALKHSGATRVSVAILLGSSTLAVEVTDNGLGYDVTNEAADRRGFGLPGMRERVQQLHGRLTIDSTPGQGTTVRVEGVPYRLVDAEELIA